MKRIQVVAQVVGFVVIGLLAVYGLTVAVGAPQALWAAAGLTAPNAPQASIPTTMSYQGILRGPDGLALTGSYTMTFRIYASSVTTETLWSEQHTDVTVRDGHFSVLLGSYTPLNTATFASSERFIGVTVAPYDEMLPRQRFASTPYTFYAQRANGLAAADGDPADAVSVDDAGNVGVGTTTPTQKLDVNGNVNVSGNVSASGNVNAGGKIGLGTAPAANFAFRSYSNGIWGGGVAAGYDSATVVMGELADVAQIGGHNADLTAWRDLAINSGGGNVGIGTTTPAQKLDVNGNIAASGGINGASLNVSGDVGWGGHLTGFTVITDSVTVSETWPTMDRPIVGNLTPENTVCFVSGYHFTVGVAGGPTNSRCEAYIHGGVEWAIWAAVVPLSGNSVECTVRCLQW